MKRCTKCGKELSDDALFCPKCGTKQVVGVELVGDMVGDRYLVQREIGRGGSGTVYRARHVALGTHVAIKVLHPSLSGDETAIERFRKEAVTVASIDNDHVVHVFDFGRLPDGRFYMVMELLEGRTLDELLDEGKSLELRKAIDITVQAAEALAEVHALGLVHRDLRPRNIFLARRKGREDFVKILDFGMSKLLMPGVSPQATLGVRFSDPIYIAPEQIRGEVVDRRTDIYSLAVLLYQMLTGRPPFSGTGAVAVLDQQLEKMPPAPSTLRPGLSPLLDAAILKALAKKRETRFETMVQFRDALLKALEKDAGARQGATARKGTPVVSGGEAAVSGGGAVAAAGAFQPESTMQAAPEKPESEPGALPLDISPDQTVLGLGGPVPPPAARDVVPKQQQEPAFGEKAASPGGASVRQDSTAGSEPSRTEAQREVRSPKVGAEGEPKAEEQGEPEAAFQAEFQEMSEKEAEPEPTPAAAEAEAGEKETGPEETAAPSESDEPSESSSGGRDAQDSGAAQPGDQPVDPTMSQLWYAEGEEAQRALAALADGDDENQNTLPAMYQQMESGPHGAPGKLLVVVALVSLSLVGLLVGILAWRHRGSSKKESVSPKETASLAAEVDAGPARPDAAVTQADAAPSPDVSMPRPRDAAILALPQDELVVPASRKHPRQRSSRHASRGSRGPGSRPRARSADNGELPTPPDEAHGVEARPVAKASEEISAGRRALRSGDLPGAKKHFLAAKAAGGGWRALAGLGEVAFEQGRYSEAVRLLRKASRSGSVRTIVLLGDAYFKSGNLRKAKAAYERALRKSPSNRAAKRNLQVVKRRLGEGG